MSATSSSDCVCGHVADAHTEAAIFPPCEGAFWPPKRVSDSGGGFWARNKGQVEACPCPGYMENEDE